MRLRDKTGGKVKARRHKASTLKRRNMLKAVRRRSSSSAGRETNVARLGRELSEAFEQQAATAEILNVISNSPTDTQPVFDAIVQSGLKLFPGALVSVALRYGDTINAAAVAAPDSARVEAWRQTISRTPLARNYMHGAALLDRRIVDIPDVADAPAEFIAGGQNFLTSGNRAITIMPMMRGGEAIGLLSVVRLVAGPLSDKQIAVLKNFRQPGRHRHRKHAAASTSCASAPANWRGRSNSRRPPAKFLRRSADRLTDFETGIRGNRSELAATVRYGSCHGAGPEGRHDPPRGRLVRCTSLSFSNRLSRQPLDREQRRWPQHDFEAGHSVRPGVGRSGRAARSAGVWRGTSDSKRLFLPQ